MTLVEELHLLLSASEILTSSSSGKSFSSLLRECTLVNSSTVAKKQLCKSEIFFQLELCLREPLFAMWRRNLEIVENWLVLQVAMQLLLPITRTLELLGSSFHLVSRK